MCVALTCVAVVFCVAYVVLCLFSLVCDCVSVVVVLGCVWLCLGLVLVWC